MPPAPSRPHLPGLLAFDTSTEQMTVAAAGPKGCVSWAGAGGALASATLLVKAGELMAEAGLSLPRLQAVAFGAGPGAFTGLRTACAAAQGLAFGLKLPVLPLDSLSLVAEGSPWRDGTVWVAMDARMDEVYAGAYAWAEGRWQVRSAPALYTLAALSERWAAEPPMQVAGNAAEVFGDRLPLAAARRQAQEADRAAALLRCALQAWHSGVRCDAAAALPVYLRDKVAQTTEERQRAKALAASVRS